MAVLSAGGEGAMRCPRRALDTECAPGGVGRTTWVRDSMVRISGPRLMLPSATVGLGRRAAQQPRVGPAAITREAVLRLLPSRVRAAGGVRCRAERAWWLG